MFCLSPMMQPKVLRLVTWNLGASPEARQCTAALREGKRCALGCPLANKHRTPAVSFKNGKRCLRKELN